MVDNNTEITAGAPVYFKDKLLVNPSPHAARPDGVSAVMLGVLIALVPAALSAVLTFGLRALAIMAVGVVSAVLTEALIQKAAGKKITVSDYSAAVTGLLLAMNVPAGTPLWIPAVGSFFAIAVVKMTFGGLGNNFLNPALGARAFLLASWPVAMTTGWGEGFKGGALSGVNIDGLSAATPLTALKENAAEYAPHAAEALKPLLMGNVGGCIGETSALALIIGGLYMMYKGYISWHIPVSYAGTVFLLTFIFTPLSSFSPEAFSLALFHVLAGGLMMGAFFMATDMVTSPITKKGKLIFGAGCGILTVIIRLKGGYPEGVSYSILLMNLAVPLIDRYAKPLKFGTLSKSEKGEMS